MSRGKTFGSSYCRGSTPSAVGMAIWPGLGRYGSSIRVIGGTLTWFCDYPLRGSLGCRLSATLSRPQWTPGGRWQSDFESFVTVRVDRSPSLAPLVPAKQLDVRHDRLVDFPFLERDLGSMEPFISSRDGCLVVAAPGVYQGFQYARGLLGIAHNRECDQEFYRRARSQMRTLHGPRTIFHGAPHRWAESPRADSYRPGLRQM